MHEVKIFLLGFGLWYIIQILDVIMNLLNSYASVIIAKNNSRINELVEPEQQTNVIGFQYIPEVEYCDDWEDE